MISSTQSTYCTSSERGGHPQSCGDCDDNDTQKDECKDKDKDRDSGEKIQFWSILKGRILRSAELRSQVI